MILIPRQIKYPITWEKPRNGKQFTALELGCFFNGITSVSATEFSTHRLFLMENADESLSRKNVNKRASNLFNMLLYGDVMIVGVSEMDNNAYRCYHDPNKEVE